MPYSNTTSFVGAMFHGNSSTIAHAGTFTVEASGSTNQLLLRNLYTYFSTTGSGNTNSSTDIYIQDTSGSTVTIPLMSGVASSLFSYLIPITSTHMLRLVNNSGTTLIYAFSGFVWKV